MEDWTFQFEYLLTQAVNLPGLSENEKSAAGLVKGCQAKVWICISGTEECIKLKGDSGSMLVKGLLALLITLLDGHSVEEINTYTIHFLTDTKLGEFLSQDRQTGVQAMLNYIKESMICK